MNDELLTWKAHACGEHTLKADALGRPHLFNAQRILPVLLGVKLAYLAALLGAVAMWPDLDGEQFYAAFQRWPRDGGPVFASHFATWDAAHYLYLSEVGYNPGAPACAFYPLWPLLVTWTAPLLGGSLLITGLILSNLCSLAAWGLFHRVVERRWGAGAADWALVFLVAFPGSLFFQFNYTESLFLLLMMILWWGLEEERPEWVWFAGCLLPLTRAIGVLVGLPMAWPFLERAWRSRGGEPGAGPPEAHSDSRAGPGHRRRGGALGSLASQPLWVLTGPLLGWAFYLALMWSWTGNGFEGFVAQKYWGVNAISHLWDVPRFVVGFFAPTTWHEYQGSVLDRCAFILLLYTLPVIWRRDKGWLVWTYVLGIIPAMSGTFVSFTRYISCAFPVFVALGLGLSRREWRWLRYALLGLFVVLHVVLVWRFVNFRWAG